MTDFDQFIYNFSKESLVFMSAKYLQDSQLPNRYYKIFMLECLCGNFI